MQRVLSEVKASVLTSRAPPQLDEVQVATKMDAKEWKDISPKLREELCVASAPLLETSKAQLSRVRHAGGAFTSPCEVDAAPLAARCASRHASQNHLPPIFFFGESNVGRMDAARCGAAREVALAEGTELEAGDWRRLFGTAKPPKEETQRTASGQPRYGVERKRVFNPVTELVEEHEVSFSCAAAGEDGHAVLGVVGLKQFRHNRAYDDVYEPDGTLALVPTGGGVRFFMLALHQRDAVRLRELYICSSEWLAL